MRAVAICLILAAWAAWPAHAAEKQSDDLFGVWFTSHVCKTKLEPGTPGSSPQMPIVLDHFDDLHDDAAEAKAQPEGKPPKPSKYECKWVQLPGYMTWTNYYHYRGYLYASAWERYGSPDVWYIVERFADKSARRFGLLRRQMTVVGRFYDLCAAADRAEKESGHNWWLFGPCHYGENKGMMLTDVTVKHVHGDKPQYLSGESNRALINDLPRVDGADFAPLESRTRDWVASIKRGLAKHAQETLASHPVWKDAKKKDRQEVEKDITDADGYAAYLSGNEAFRQLNVATAPVAVFWNSLSEASEKKSAWGCICLRPDCTDRWPLQSYDATKFIGDAACTQLSREDTASAWYWE